MAAVPRSESPVGCGASDAIPPLGVLATFAPPRASVSKIIPTVYVFAVVLIGEILIGLLVPRAESLSSLRGTFAHAVMLGLATVCGILPLLFILCRRAERAWATIAQQGVDLARKETRWQFALDGAEHGIWDWNLQTNALFLSSRFKAILGFDDDEFVSSLDEWAALLHPEDKAGVFSALQGHAETGTEMYQSKHRIRCKNGAYKWVQGRGKVTERAADGKALRMIGTYTDINAHQTAEAALRASERRLHDIAARVPGVVFQFRLSAEGKMSMPYASETIRQVLEVTPDEVRDDASAVFKNVDSAALPGHMASILESARTLEAWVHEFPITLASGERRWIGGESLPVKEADGAVLWTGFLADITERKNAAQIIQREKAFVETLLMNLVIPTFVLNPDGTVRIWNRAIEELSGVAASLVVGTRGHRQALFGDDQPTLADVILTGKIPEFADQNMQPQRLEYVKDGLYSENWCAPQTGKTVYLAGAAGPIYHADGSLAAVVETLHDLTPQKNLQTELVQARDEALSATRAKSTFLANMSHEIRTPMNGVIGMAALLMESDLTVEHRDFVETIRSSGEHLLSIINGILDFSKVEAGKLELETIDFDLWDVLEDVASSLALHSGDKGLDFTCLADPALPALLRGDPGRLRQILINLGGNALKFTAAGEVVIQASLIEQNGAAVTVRFEVRDTGIGVPADCVDELFQAFNQADVSTTRKFGGTGLGLAICKQLAELMGGAIGVVSEPGGGSTFWFTSVLQCQTGSAFGARTRPGDVAGSRILIVDDNATNRRLLQVLLEGWGCRHDVAASGQEALALLKAACARGESYQLALLDTQMPEMDGEELARRIKADVALAGTELVLLTSMGHYGEADRAGPTDFAARLCKPLRRSALYDCIATVLYRRQATAREADAAMPSRRINPKTQHGCRLLLVEDNAVNQKVALAILGKLGYLVDVAENGAVAIERLATASYDLVLMDCQMPVMDGYEATRMIRDPVSPVCNHAIPIVAMTANAMAGDRQICLAAGMNDHLPKPIDPRALAQMLLKWLPPVASREAADTSIPIESALVQGTVIFDRAQLLERVLGDEAVANAVVEAFLGDIVRSQTALAEALANNDAAHSARICHTIKGTAANVGAQSLCDIALKLETFAKTRDFEALRSHLPELHRQLVQFQEQAVAA